MGLIQYFCGIYLFIYLSICISFCFATEIGIKDWEFSLASKINNLISRKKLHINRFHNKITHVMK